MGLARYDDVIARVIDLPAPSLIAIDGLPVSGKSTLAEQLSESLGLDCLYLDDFVRPPSDWPSRTQPAFPFAYIRYDEFVSAIRDLAQTGACAYYPFDWSTLTVSAAPKRLSLARSVIVEGVSALNPALIALYGLTIFVESDRDTTLAAAHERGVGDWGAEWAQLFLPSADLYMRTAPQDRADLLYAGRGVAAEA